METDEEKSEDSGKAEPITNKENILCETNDKKTEKYIDTSHAILLNRSLIIGNSDIQGTGVFARCYIPKGSAVISFANDSFCISENDYENRQRKGDELMMKTGCRYVADVFLCTDNRVRVENYINHSFEPNMLYHVGVCFALRDIASGEEVTVDYRYILSENDPGYFLDNNSGKIVRGFNGYDSLRRSTRILLNLMDELVDDTNETSSTYTI